MHRAGSNMQRVSVKEKHSDDPDVDWRVVLKQSLKI